MRDYNLLRWKARRASVMKAMLRGRESYRVGVEEFQIGDLTQVWVPLPLGSELELWVLDTIQKANKQDWLIPQLPNPLRTRQGSSLTCLEV